ncbi:MAG: methyltransferase [Pseudonocardiaceae bacterium]
MPPTTTTGPAAAATGPADGEVPAPVRMIELLAGFQLSQALYVVAKCDIASALVGGPRPVAELADATGCDPGALRRLLRTLAAAGLFTHHRDGTVALTPLGATLADDVPGSVRDLALMWMETHYAPFARLIDTMRTGVPAATVHYGRPFFDWLAEHPEQVARFTAAMADHTGGIKAGVLTGYRLPAGRTVADIGGADGTLLADLLTTDPDPSRRGIVFDLPHVVPAAPALLTARGLDARVTAQGGDFFDAVPAADVYVLSWILHDWDDIARTRILAGIAAAATSGARLVVIEMVIPAGDAPHPAKTIDLTMLGMLTGTERTRAEFETLLAAAGFTLDRLIPGSDGSPYSVLEATLL